MVGRLGSQYLNSHPDSWSRPLPLFHMERQYSVLWDRCSEQHNQLSTQLWMDSLPFVLAPLLCLSTAPEWHPLSQHSSKLPTVANCLPPPPFLTSHSPLLRAQVWSGRHPGELVMDPPRQPLLSASTLNLNLAISQSNGCLFFLR